ALLHWQRAALDLRSLPPTQQGTRDEADVRLRLMEAEAVLDGEIDDFIEAYLLAAAGGTLAKGGVNDDLDA
ncbi:MAG TPA: hypothetical protein VM580_27395, partial [Labilithrix sp.]|nr:hypothetical protein [Labilithrix sp.]